MDDLFNEEIEECEKYLEKKNVVGFSKRSKKRIKDGEEVNEYVIRFYVDKKVPERFLSDIDKIPEKICGMETDVVPIGKLELEIPKEKRRETIRPLKGGVSCGNSNITAGTLGWFYKKDSRYYIGSNAHVLCDDATLPLDEQDSKHILQPGSLDGGKFKDLVGQLDWFKIITPNETKSKCKVAMAWGKLGNILSKGLGRTSRFKQVVKGSKNVIDFALAKIDDESEFSKEMFSLKKFGEYKIGGHLFAGSERVSIHCKISNIIEESGAKPILLEYRDPKVGDTLIKEGRTTGITQGEVIDDCAEVNVSGFNGVATFDDVVITEDMSRPGDSGSAVLIKE